MGPTEFLMALGVIIMIDIVLGGDNAVVLALASKNLPAEQRKKAIFWGAALAIAIRAALTLVAVWLLNIPFLMLIGGLLLLWIAVKLLKEDKSDEHIQAEYTLAAAIKTIVIADVVMGVDNILAIAGASKGSPVLVVLGLLISIPIIIWGSNLILKLIDKYPIVTYIGAAVLAYTAGSMITHEKKIATFLDAEPYLVWLIPIMSIVFVLLIGYTRNVKVKKVADER